MNNKKTRRSILTRIAEEQSLEKKAQEIVDSTKTEQVDGQQVADDIFNKIMDSLTIEELERESGL